MNKFFKRIIVVCLSVLLMTQFVSCASTNNAGLEHKLSLVGFVTEKEFDRYNNIDEASVVCPNGYKMIKIDVELTNVSKNSIRMIDVVDYSDDFLIVKSGAFDYEPTMELEPGKTSTWGLYAFVKDGVEQEKIPEIIDNADISFSYDTVKR